MSLTNQAHQIWCHVCDLEVAMHTALQWLPLSSLDYALLQDKATDEIRLVADKHPLYATCAIYQ